MTREEYHAQKALQEKRRATERKSREAAKGAMDLPFLLLTALWALIHRSIADRTAAALRGLFQMMVSCCLICVRNAGH